MEREVLGPMVTSAVPQKGKRKGKGKHGHAHPYLTGNFAPVSKTHAPTPCTYTGTIPRELLGGEYVRNGANPVTNEDLGRDAHWFDGDGMLAGVLFQRSPSNPHETIPHFVNQYILTDLCRSSFENPALRSPIMFSISTLINPLSGFLKVMFSIFRSVFLVLLSHLFSTQQAIKRISVANTAIYFHDGRALATCESGPPMRIQLPGLETVGWFDGNAAEGESPCQDESRDKEDGFGGTGPLSWIREWTTGHPKVDPRTGELILFHCSFLPPYVHYSVIPSTASGSPEKNLSKMLNVPVPRCSGGKMMHDFGVSLRHTVILDLPLSLTPGNSIKNQPVLRYEPDKPARFGVFPRRDPTSVQWFETEACCIFHTANTWDDCDEEGNTTAVNMLACRLTSANLVFSSAGLAPPPNPKKRESEKQRPMSFFSKYDDDEKADLERFSPQEETPLLTAIDATVHESAASVPPIMHDNDEHCRLYHYRFALKEQNPIITRQYALSAIPFEFPALNPTYEMSTARYVYGCSTSMDCFGSALGKATKIDVMVKFDVQTLLTRGESHPPENITGCVDNRNILQVMKSKEVNEPIRTFKMPPNWYAQEARFVSRANPVSEDDGYLLFYAFDESQLDEIGECPRTATSELWIIDAKNFGEVIARVRLPQRVPYGLHGNWFTETQIENQRAVHTVRTLATKAKNTWGTKAKASLISALG